MAAPVLSTKLFVPLPRTKTVHRPRLIQRLDERLDPDRRIQGALVLLSASPGFGKTTIVTQWLSARKERGQTAAWISLDEGENEPARFLLYFTSALQMISPHIGERAMTILRSSRVPPTQAVLSVLINDIAASPDDCILVLDDYQRITSKDVNNAFLFFIRHIPPNMVLVVATREDPNLPLAHLRSRGQLTELRNGDLRFTNQEAADFLGRVMNLDLSSQEVATLAARTEGWVAGLQMAALSVEGRENSARLIGDFTGGHRYILDYLVEEVLTRRPSDVREFLLKTSLLDRLSGPLCNAVTDRKNGEKVLQELERGNLFVVPLDGARRWYRYHHLFSDVLKTHLMEEYSGEVVSLHRLASRWFEHNGFPADAVRHAIAAGDLERVADLAETLWRSMDGSFQLADWLGWLKVLPDELIRNRPVLSVQYAETLSDVGELGASESRLQEAEAWLGSDLDGPPNAVSSSADGMVVIDQEQFRSMAGKIAIVRAGNAQVNGDIPGAMRYARTALDILPEEDHLSRAQAAVTVGFIHWRNGDLSEARKTVRDWIESMKRAGNIFFAVASAYALGDILVAQGRLREARRTYRNALELAEGPGEHMRFFISHLHLGLAMLYHETGIQRARDAHLERAKEFWAQNTLIDWSYRWFVAQAQLAESAGDYETALELLEEAEALYIRNPIPDTRPVDARRAKVHLKQGRLNRVDEWVKRNELYPPDEMSYLHEFELITRARFLTARYRENGDERDITEALSLLERLLAAGETSNRTGSVIEIGIALAISHQTRGDSQRALDSLERALVSAEPEGYIRIFVDEGDAMKNLLRDVMKRTAVPDYVRLLRTTYGEENGRPASRLLREPLSARELEVLRLLGTELNGPEIAGKLFISLNTVRTHTKNVYRKLEVNNRMAAVCVAKKLDLL